MRGSVCVFVVSTLGGGGGWGMFALQVLGL